MDRAQADALARELVTQGAFRWVAGMAFRYRDSRGDGRKYGPWHSGMMTSSRPLAGKRDHPPDLLDETTAACLAVQAMEAGASLEPASADDWLAWTGPGTEPYWSTRGPLGIVAAQALLALRGAP